MIKYLLSFLFFLACLPLFATDYYWVGGATGNFDDKSKWSATSGGTALSAGTITWGTTDIAYLDNATTATITLNGNYSIGKLVVRGSSNYTIKPDAAATANRTLTVNTVTGGAPYSFHINALSSLTVLGLDAATDRNATIALASTTGVQANINGPLKVGLDNGQTTAFGAILKGALATVQFNNGGIYEHATAGGTIPTSTWITGSICKVTGSTTAAPTGLGQTFHHFEWACPNQANNIGFTNVPTTVNGNFTVSNTSTFEVRLASSATTTLAVGGNFVLSGSAKFVGISQTGAPNVTINVAGNYIQSGTSIFSLTNTTSSNVTGNSLNVTGYFSQSGGTFNLTSNASKNKVNVDSFAVTGTGTIFNIANGASAANNSIVTITGGFYLGSGAILKGATTATNLNSELRFAMPVSKIVSYTQLGSIGTSSTDNNLIIKTLGGAGTLLLRSDASWPFYVGLSAGTIDFGTPTLRTLTLSATLGQNIQNWDLSGSAFQFNDLAHRIKLMGGNTSPNSNATNTLVWPATISGGANWVTEFANAGDDVTNLIVTGTATLVDVEKTGTGVVDISNTQTNDNTALTFTCRNYTQSAGDFGVVGKNCHQTGTTSLEHKLIVNGNLSVSGGRLETQRTTVATVGVKGTINLLGDVSFTGIGSIQADNTVTFGLSEVNFAKNGTQFLTYSSSTACSQVATTLPFYVRNSGSMGPSIVEFADNSSVFLGADNSTIKTTFTVEDGTGLTILHANGIAPASTASGCIQNGTGGRTFSSKANYTYKGSTAQITGTGLPSSLTTSTGILKINNSSAMTGTGVTLSQATTMGTTATLNLTAGKLTTTSTNLMTVNSDATLSGGSTASFVSGPIKRGTVLASAYLFPVGKSDKYRPCSVIPDATNASTYTGEYFNAGYGTYTKVSPLVNISTKEYWDIAKNTGANAKLNLTWNETIFNSDLDGLLNSPAVTYPLVKLVVAHWNSGTGKWEDAGQTARSGVYNTSGTVTSKSQASFSPFTFAKSLLNPLPVKLIAFTGNNKNSENHLAWQTATEIQNSGFEIERSSDGESFEKIGWVEGNGTTTDIQKYSFLDRDIALTNKWYYRLKQLDFDGHLEYSNILSISTLATQQQLVFDEVAVDNNGQKPNRLHFISNVSLPIRCSLFSATGQLFYEELMTAFPGLNIVSIPSLPTGIYFISLQCETEKKVLKLVLE